jgi:RNA polymerase sigma-70 factor (ECF subfamily)
MEHSGRSPSGGSVSVRDDRWFEALFTQFHGPVRAYASRRAPDDADDIIADVFAVAWRKREDVPDNALPWLYAVAAKEMLHTSRAHDRRDRLGRRLQATTSLVHPDPAEQIAVRLDAQAPVTRALALLPERDAEILRLWAWEHLEPAEIALVLGISSVASRVRLHRARRRLESILLTAPHNHGGESVDLSGQPNPSVSTLECPS